MSVGFRCAPLADSGIGVGITKYQRAFYTMLEEERVV